MCAVRFRLVTSVPLKQVTWSGIKWTSVDDSKLLVGVYQYGLGNWESIKEDTSVGLSKKVSKSHCYCVCIYVIYRYYLLID